MATLTHSPAKITARLLADLGLAADPDAVVPPAKPGDWCVYADRKPPEFPDRCVWVVNSAGQDDGRAQLGGELFEHYGVVVGVRGRTAAEAWARAASVRAGLAEDATGRAVWIGTPPAGTPYAGVSYSRIGTPVRAGTEPGSDRPLYTVSALMTCTAEDFPRPLAYYPLDSDVTDASGNGKDLTDSGAVFEDDGGKFGDAVNHHGGSRTNDLLTGAVKTGPYTLTMWVRGSGSGSPASGQVEVLTGGGAIAFSVGMSVIAGVPDVDVRWASNGAASAAQVLSADAWHLVAVVVNDGSGLVYYDSVLDETVDLSALTMAFSDGGTGTFDVNVQTAGDRIRIDDVAVFDEALTAAQVALLWRGGFGRTAMLGLG